MNIKDVLIYFNFRQTNVARALGVSRGCISHWYKIGRIPYGKQCELELITDGKLKANKED
jgi:hypothetical protein